MEKKSPRAIAIRRRISSRRGVFLHRQEHDLRANIVGTGTAREGEKLQIHQV